MAPSSFVYTLQDLCRTVCYTYFKSRQKMVMMTSSNRKKHVTDPITKTTTDGSAFSNKRTTQSDRLINERHLETVQ